MILRIVEIDVTGPASLRLTFNNGVTRRVNVVRLLTGSVFEPLKDPAFFHRVVLDASRGTVVWPNGAAFAPATLYELPEAAGVSEAGGEVSAI